MGETRPEKSDRSGSPGGPSKGSRRPRRPRRPGLPSLDDLFGWDALDRLSARRKWVGGARPWNVSAAFPRAGSLAERAQFLLRYAVLAPSMYNTQPWLFTVVGDEIRLFVDADRWLTVADPDKRELYLGLGAALENLLVAAEHFGVDQEVRYLPGSDSRHAATVTLSPDGEPSDHRGSTLFEAIPRRRTNGGRYRERPVPREDLRALRSVCVEEDVGLQFVTDPDEIGRVAELAARADRRQFADPAYRRELGRWVGRGAFGDPWPTAKGKKLVVTYLNLGRRRARRKAALIRGAPVLGVVRTETDSRRAQIRAGQVFERVGLLATALGIQTHPTSSMLEVPSLRRELIGLLGRPDWTPQCVFRLGYARDESGPSPRRSHEAVLVD